MAKALRALGRSLSDFPNLNDAEREVVLATREGRLADFGKKPPETDEEKRPVLYAPAWCASWRLAVMRSGRSMSEAFRSRARFVSVAANFIKRMDME